MPEEAARRAAGVHLPRAEAARGGEADPGGHSLQPLLRVQGPPHSRRARELLKELGFVLYTEHPHKFILNYAKLLTLDDATFKKLAQYAWNFINDSQRTDVCMRYPPETICCAALWMGARVLQIKLPSSSEPPWWELFDAKREDMDAVCERVTALYSRPRATFIDLYAQSQQAAAAAAAALGKLSHHGAAHVFTVRQSSCSLDFGAVTVTVCTCVNLKILLYCELLRELRRLHRHFTTEALSGSAARLHSKGPLLSLTLQ